MLNAVDCYAQSNETADQLTSVEIGYKYEGYNSTSKLYRYRITAKLYQDCNTPKPFPQSINVKISDAAGGTWSSPINLIRLTGSGTTTTTLYDSCSVGPRDACYKFSYYSLSVWMPALPYGIKLSYWGEKRDSSISNIKHPVNTGAIGLIPGNLSDTSAPRNSSPEFFRNEAPVFCANSPMSYDLSARDADMDSLDYSFTDALEAGLQGIRYTNPYSPPYPMGRQVSINNKTGIISGRAPAAGSYLVTLSVSEFRKGKLIAISQKEYLIRVTDCTIARAETIPDIMSCSGYTVSFSNAVHNSVIKSYQWDFGVPSATTDTSTQQKPVYTFPDTGLYKVRLVINEGDICDDTAFSNVYVYPFLTPDFRIESDCVFPDSMARFRDLSTTTVNNVVKWRWDLGRKTDRDQIQNDTSALQNPVYNYPRSGLYTISLIATTSRGCQDTVTKNIRILDYNMLQLTNDTAICIGDTLQLHANGTGTIQWTPAYRISNVYHPQPYVYPDIGTRYHAALTLFPGCIINKSVWVDSKRLITVNAGADTTICLTDSMQLYAAGDGLKYRWTPSNTLNNAFIRSPKAKPNAITTLYKVVANTGSCVASDSILVTAIPYPAVNSWPGDTSICYGDIIELNASGGNEYKWTPVTALSNPSVASPFANPRDTITYTVTVTDILGCPKPVFKKIEIAVVPPVKAFAGYDTAIIMNQPLQLRASGSLNYSWSPSTGLNNPYIANPVATLQENITYRVKASTKEGCTGYDDIAVKVFRVAAPDIFVPNAFTPNGDGRHDQIRPSPVGIKEFHYFRIYNRWGQLIYHSTIPTSGWTGIMNGKQMPTSTYAWEAKGIDYAGKAIIKRGTFVLIR